MTQHDLPAMPPKLPERRDAGRHGADVAPSPRAGDSVGGDEKGRFAGSWLRCLSRWNRFRRRQTASFATSVAFHATVLVALALIVEAGRSFSPFDGLTMTPSRPVKLDSVEPVMPRPEQATSWDRIEGQKLAVAREPAEPRLEPTMESPSESLSTARLDPLGLDPDKLLQKADSLAGALDGRRPGRRAQLAADRGGTPESEAAVERGLRWLAAQQHKDGSWTFYHPKDMTRRPYADPGTETSTTAATAMALLPFLGAGQTHVAGEYQETVARGLYYLNNRANMTPHGADLQEGTMYAQGLGAIALCEAYGLTRDETLKGLAARAVEFIVYAQDKNGGGWRYTPGQPGDTTVTGWQLMALKSAEMAGLHV
ncbi:MAG: hypothetical protein GX621_07160, partial [Pirellulaceae bacterium]|nr:hypothetical protein [Pirellulaceae bacterium]